MWDVEYTDQFETWWQTLSEHEQEAVTAAVEALETHGATLGRPFVDVLHSSRHAHMKELRPRGGNIRILFAFDPRRTAVLLIGGDKSGRWESWYRDNIPVADDLYDEHLSSVQREGQSE